MWNLSDKACLQRLWPMLKLGASICNIGAGRPAPAAGAAPAGGPAPPTTADPAEGKKVGEKKEESKESDDDMGSGLSD